MAIVFHAHCVAIEDMDDFWLVGFADDKFNTRDYLMLQRAFEHDEQDVSLGMNTYHVERNGQGWSGYGGIMAFELRRDRAKIVFTKEGAATMGNVTEMEITFRVDGDEYSKLKDRLGKIFAGAGCLVE
ncbi:MAG: Imm10 family immunity protein [Gemmataceae bacterium]